MAFMRFEIPDYDFKAFKNLSWEAPSFITDSEIQRLKNAQAAGDSGSYGCYPVEVETTLLDKFDIRGDHSHAVMCVTPSIRVHLLGRSYAWWNQRALVLDSLNAADVNVVHDWRTPRPMNNRLGPDHGVDLDGGIYYLISSHMYDDYWLANRTITDTAWDGDDTADGFRILGASKDSANEFCECNMSFTWAV
jgi:hypothetical protein